MVLEKQDLAVGVAFTKYPRTDRSLHLYETSSSYPVSLIVKKNLQRNHSFRATIKEKF